MCVLLFIWHMYLSTYLPVYIYICIYIHRYRTTWFGMLTQKATPWDVPSWQTAPWPWSKLAQGTWTTSGCCWDTAGDPPWFKTPKQPWKAWCECALAGKTCDKDAQTPSLVGRSHQNGETCSSILHSIFLNISMEFVFDVFDINGDQLWNIKDFKNCTACNSRTLVSTMPADFVHR